MQWLVASLVLSVVLTVVLNVALHRPIMDALLHLREHGQVNTLMHRHTNCCLRYSSGLEGAVENDMIMIAGNLARDPQQTVVAARGRIAVSVYQAFSQGKIGEGFKALTRTGNLGSLGSVLEELPWILRF